MVRTSLPLLAMLALAACTGNSSSGVGVALRLDTVSCGGSAQQLQLSCGGQVWIHVENASGATIADSCVDLGTGSLPFSSLAGALGEGLDLGRLPSDEPIRISLSLFDQSVASCPQGMAGFTPSVYGQSALAVLDPSGADVELPLSCTTTIPGGPPPSGIECQLCDASFQQCLSAASANSCDQIFQSCFLGCSDLQNGCPACNLLVQRCQEGTPPQLSCDGFTEECLLKECPGIPDLCAGQCQVAESQCTSSQLAIDACVGDRVSCERQCDPAQSCLQLVGL